MPCDSVPLFLSNPLLSDTQSQNESSTHTLGHIISALVGSQAELGENGATEA